MYLIRENPPCPSCRNDTYLTRNGGGGFFRCKSHPACKGTISTVQAYKAQLKNDKAKAKQFEVNLAVQAIKRMRQENA